MLSNATFVALVKGATSVTNARTSAPTARLEESGGAHGGDPALSRYYQVVFIWMRDPETFGCYCDLARPVVAPYGGMLERMLLPEAVVGDGMAKPDIVNIVFYDSGAAFAALDADPQFQRIVPMRTASIDMASIEGRPIGGASSQERVEDRRYLVEVAQFGPLGSRGYADYEAQAEPLMSRHGYRVERVLRPDAASGFPFTPDVVKVASFDGAGLEAWHQDEAHQRVAQELYPAAVRQSIWLTGRVHPATLNTPGD